MPSSDPALRVRAARPADADAIAAVHVASWRAAYHDLMPAAYLAAMSEPEEAARWARSLPLEELRPRRTLLAENASGVPLGYATVSEDSEAPGFGLLFLMYVLPEMWGHGVGDALMQAAETQLLEFGLPDAHLWVLEANTRARRFYERHGWRADGAERTSTYGDAVLNAVRYRRRLPKGGT